MCVILCCEDSFPKYNTLKQAQMMNSDGAGIAWLENGVVQFRKGTNAKAIWNLIQSGKVKLPCIIHFRIASVGSVKDTLTHPFPINQGVDLRLKGSAKSVLFHNGTIWDHEALMFKVALGKKVYVPDGDWSDSRALAWICYNNGIDTMERITGWNKIAVLTPNGIKKFGDGWVDFNKNQVSNDYFITDKGYNRPNINTWYREESEIEDSALTRVKNEVFEFIEEDPIFKELEDKYQMDPDEIYRYYESGYDLKEILSFKAEEANSFEDDYFKVISQDIKNQGV